MWVLAAECAGGWVLAAKCAGGDGFFLPPSPATALLVGRLRSADVQADAEALVYGVGTIKLLASNPQVRASLSEARVLELLAGILTSCSEVSGGGGGGGHVYTCVQTCACMSHCSECKGYGSVPTLAQDAERAHAASVLVQASSCTLLI